MLYQHAVRSTSRSASLTCTHNTVRSHPFPHRLSELRCSGGFPYSHHLLTSWAWWRSAAQNHTHRASARSAAPPKSRTCAGRHIARACKTSARLGSGSRGGERVRAPLGRRGDALAREVRVRKVGDRRVFTMLDQLRQRKVVACHVDTPPGLRRLEAGRSGLDDVVYMDHVHALSPVELRAHTRGWQGQRAGRLPCVFRLVPGR